MVEALLQRALEMGKRFAAASEPHGFADVVAAGTAARAGVARNADLERDVVANSEGRGGIAADGGDDAGGLVAEGKRFLDENVAVAEVGVVV